MDLDKIVDKINKYYSKPFWLTYGIALSLTAGADIASYYINEFVPKGGKTIVFTSGNDDHDRLPYVVKAKIIDFFMYTPITLRQNINGNQVTWISNATKKEVLDGLGDPQYQNVVFIGHGNGYTFGAADQDVYAKDIYELDISKKSGELIQHTCGGGPDQFREVLLSIPEKGYGFKKQVNVKENYVTAWKRLFE